MIVCELEAKRVVKMVEVGKQVAPQGVEAIKLSYGIVGAIVKVDPLQV